jgi:hypothetical protein
MKEKRVEEMNRLAEFLCMIKTTSILPSWGKINQIIFLKE